MLNTDKYAVDNQKLVSRLLPYFLRGKKILLFLLSIISPIESLHFNWRKWALAKTIEASASTQPVVFRWYLKKMLQPYMANPNDEFRIGVGEAEYYLYIFEDDADFNKYTNFGYYWLFENLADKNDIVNRHIDNAGEENWILIKERGENTDDTEAAVTISAPSHISTISDSDYVRMIKQCVEKYLVYDIQYEITINKQYIV